MPKTLIGWFWFIALMAACVVPRMAAADDLMDCVYRGQLAEKFATTVAEGYSLDAINVRFQRLPQNPVEQAEMDAYVESVRAEVKPMLGMEPGKIGMRVAEACAFEYGKKHGYMKDVSADPTWDGVTFGSPLMKARVKKIATFIDNEAPLEEVLAHRELRRIGSSPPLSEKQITEMIMGPGTVDLAASSQAMAEANRRFKECDKLLSDQIFIGSQLARGKSADALRHLARTSEEPLTPKHLEKVLKLIDEAEEAVGKNALKTWFDSYWYACTDGI